MATARSSRRRSCCPASASAIIFVRARERRDRPILPIDLLARPVSRLSAIGGFTAFTASMTLLISTPFRLHALGFRRRGDRRGDRAVAAHQHVRRAAAGFPVGSHSGRDTRRDRHGRVDLRAAAARLPAAHPSYFDVAWRMALCGSGFGTFLPPNARLIVGSAPRERAAAAGGLVSTVRLAGQTTGATVVAALLALGVGEGFGAPARVGRPRARSPACAASRGCAPRSATRKRRKSQTKSRRSSTHDRTGSRRPAAGRAGMTERRRDEPR